MKKYYISYYRDFGNTYNLYWAETSEQIAALPENAKQITHARLGESAQRKNPPGGMTRALAASPAP